MIDIAYFGKKLKIQESPKSKLKKKKELKSIYDRVEHGLIGYCL